MQKFFLACGLQAHKQVSEYSRNRFIKVFGGHQEDRGQSAGRDKSKRSGQPKRLTIEEEMNAFDLWIDKSIYNACEGRPTDIKTLERGSYMDLLSVLDNYFEKVEKHNAYLEKLESERRHNNRK